MRLISRSFRWPPDLVERLDRRRDKTGVPTTAFLARLIDAALKREQQARRKSAAPKAARRDAG